MRARVLLRFAIVIPRYPVPRSIPSAMHLDLLGSVVLFLVLTFGLAWPLASRCALPPAEKLVATAALSLLGVFLCAWGVYVFAVPLVTLWLLPGLAVAGLAAGHRSFSALARDPAVRELFGAQLLVMLWCTGWLATIGSYAGGGWAADWFEHWERTRFFLERLPADTKLLGFYPLTARPPLANVVTGAFLYLTRADFPHYQLFSTLFASIAFLPAALLARRFQFWQAGDGGRSSVPVAGVLAVLFMVNPLFIQNATFAWTKLPAAFFILGSVWFFLRAQDADAPPAAAILCAALLAAGMLAHYSAGPYAVMIAGLWFVLEWRRRHDRARLRTTVHAAIAGAAILGAWFGWSMIVYGVQGTLLSNTSVTSEDIRRGNQLARVALNVFDSLVPHLLRPMDTTLIEQRSAWGWWRDWLFQCYQLNLPLAFGSVAWVVLGLELRRAGRTATPRARAGWSLFVVGSIALGLAAHGARDHWGLTHICLQAIVLLGLAFLAGRWAALSRPWRLALVAGATVDFMLGIALHFALQNHALARWVTGTDSTVAAFTLFSPGAMMNFRAKILNQVAFFGDALAAPLLLVVAGLAGTLLLALARARGPGNTKANQPVRNEHSS